MNNFTKEELQEMYAALCDRHESIEDFVPAQALRHKIQSMIDTYCEHIWTDGSGNHIYCGKCHKYGEKR